MVQLIYYVYYRKSYSKYSKKNTKETETELVHIHNKLSDKNLIKS